MNNSNKNTQQQNISSYDSSSGISSSSATSLQRTSNIFAGSINGDGASGDHQHYQQLWLDEPVKGIKDLDIPKVNIQSGDNSTITGDNAIKNQNGQMKHGEIWNGQQSSNGPNDVNDINSLRVSKNIGKKNRFVVR